MTERVPLVRRVGNTRWGRDELTTLVALVDAEDLALVQGFTWRLHKEGYAYTSVNLKPVLMHRLILGLTPGDGVHTDHKNHNRLDNRRSNLIPGTQADNNRNPGTRKHTSDFPGVGLHACGRWRARHRNKHLGLFGTELEAVAAIEKAKGNGRVGQPA